MDFGWWFWVGGLITKITWTQTTGEVQHIRIRERKFSYGHVLVLVVSSSKVMRTARDRNVGTK